MKNKKYVIALSIIATIIIIFLLFGVSKPDEELQKAKTISVIDAKTGFSQTEGTTELSKDSYSFEFEGYGPGKSHVGTFNDITANYIKSGSKLTYLEIKINVDSVNTGISKLDTHLKSSDFFDSENYESVVFISKEITENSVTGDLTLKDTTKEITFDVTTIDSTLSADFLLNIRDFEVSYIGINDQVRLGFTLNY